MPIRICCAEVTDQAISLADHHEQVRQACEGKAGALVGFEGVVRDHDDERRVTRLEYTAHPTATSVLRDVVENWLALHADAVTVRGVAVSHRIGSLNVGDVAFVVAVAADHRAQAFGVCSGIVDEVKLKLPVWKHQHFADGTDEWVGSA